MKGGTLRKSQAEFDGVTRQVCIFSIHQITKSPLEGVSVCIDRPGLEQSLWKDWPCKWGTPTASQQQDIAAWVYKEVQDALTAWFPPHETVAGKVPR
jgi:hypothetical protein